MTFVAIKGVTLIMVAKIMHTLFGKEYTEYQTLKLVKDCYVDWRASAGNLHHLKQLHQKYNVKWLKNNYHWH